MAPEITPAVALAVAGLGMTAQQARSLWRALTSRRWTRTTGRIISSGFVDGSRGASAATAAVEYEYKAAGKRRRSNVVNWNGFTYKSARRAFERYNPGDAVTVRYHPRHPERAVLEPGIRLFSWVWMAVASAFLLAGLAWITIVVRAT